MHTALPQFLLPTQVRRSSNSTHINHKPPGHMTINKRNDCDNICNVFFSEPLLLLFAANRRQPATEDLTWFAGLGGHKRRGKPILQRRSVHSRSSRKLSTWGFASLRNSSKGLHMNKTRQCKQKHMHYCGVLNVTSVSFGYTYMVWVLWMS